jgi:transposase-like protein
MFTQSPDKVESNPLRQILVERGHTVRSAARELGIHPTTFSYHLAAHDERASFAQRIAELPPRTPPKLRARKSTKTKKATAA